MIQPSKYENLSEREQYSYSPIYAKYKSKKVRYYNECEYCGHREFMGWEVEKTPIGEPIGYEKINPIFPYELDRMFNDHLIDQVTRSNVFAEKILNKKPKAEDKES